METRYDLTTARKKLGSLCERAARGEVIVIERPGASAVAMAQAASFAELLARACPFSLGAEVGKDRVAMWVEDPPVRAEAADFETAVDALAQALIDHAELWVKQLCFCPDHGGTAGPVRRIRLAGTVGAVREMLLADAEASGGGAESLQALATRL